MARLGTQVGKLYRTVMVDCGVGLGHVEISQLIFGVGTPEYPMKSEPNTSLKGAEVPYLTCQLQLREWQTH